MFDRLLLAALPLDRLFLIVFSDQSFSQAQPISMDLAARMIALTIAHLVSVILPLMFVSILARAGKTGFELAVLTMPVIGWVYRSVFAPETYYRIDTLLMFQSTVHSAMMEVIDSLTTEKGVRALSVDERKPVFTGFLHGL